MIDPFQTLGVEPRFTLDMRSLEQRHRELSRALHPDRYAGAPAAERRMALSRAIEVNEAFRVLKDPVRRAEALFAKAGMSTSETATPKASPALLMEILESREELADAGRDKNLRRVEELGRAMQAREQSVLESLARGFDGANGDIQRIEPLLPLLGELRYLRRFLEEVSVIEEQLTI